MGYSVYVIDNDLPASVPEAQRLEIVDTAELNASNLRLLLRNVAWKDPVVKDLITKLLDETGSDGGNKWEVSGFTNPFFCLNAINDGKFRADLIVFDWEYPGAQTGASTTSESALQQILENTFSLVFIFSGVDKRSEIEQVLSSKPFEKFKDRLIYLDKVSSASNQCSLLLSEADARYRKNFSFKFAKTLRRRSVQCADQILSEMGRATLNDVSNLLSVDGKSGKKDFVDFLTERFRASLADISLYSLLDEMTTIVESEDKVVQDVEMPVARTADPEPINQYTDMASSVWSYRLYFGQDPGDDLVRRGDILQHNGEYLLVCSADCDLGRLWNKCLGIVNTIGLYPVQADSAALMNWLTLSAKSQELSKGNWSSMLNNLGGLAVGPFILPLVPLEGFTNFVAIPRDIQSHKLTTPSGWDTFTKKQKQDQSLHYKYWPDAKRICTVAEPFLTPVIQHILSTIAGYGVPDYPPVMQALLKKAMEDFGKSVQSAIDAIVPPVASIAIVPPMAPIVAAKLSETA
jgi:hypothetical protein